MNPGSETRLLDSSNQSVALVINKILGEITLSDTADSTWSGNCIWCTTDMTLKVVLQGDAATTGTTLNFSAGYHPVRVRRIYSTGSTVNSGKVYAWA